MKCPFCRKIGDKVIDSRLTKSGYTTRRRRECLYCNNRFTTYENIEVISITVSKKDGRQEPFNNEKIKVGICKALEKLDVSLSTVNKINRELELELRLTGKKEISSSEIGEKVMGKLKELSDIAYVRFVSVYREFKNIDDFMFELRNLIERKN